MRTAFEPEGDLRGVDVLAAFVALWRESGSGSLQFSRSGATAGFEIAGGELVASSSSDPRFDTAAILVRAGKLDTRTLERLAAPEGADRALLALQAGVLTRREYRWGEKIRAVEILSDLLTWLEGDYFFLPTEEPERETTEPRLPIPRLILELFLRSRDRSLVLKHLGGADVPLARASNFDAEFATFGLTADAESVVRLIDGTSSAAEIASEAPAESFAIEKLLAALVTLGLIQPAFAGGGPADLRPPGPLEVEREPVGPAGSEEEDAREEEGREEGGREEEGSREDEDRAEEAEEEVPAADVERMDEGPVGPPEILDEPAGTWDVRDLQAEEAEPGEGPSELGDEIEDEADERADEVPGEEPVDAPLSGRASVAPDLEFASLGDEPGRVAAETSDVPVGEAAGFDRPLDTASGGDVDRPPKRSGSLLLWVLALLAAGVVAILWLRGRTPAAPSVAVAGPAATATEMPTTPVGPGPETTPAPSSPVPAAAVATEAPTPAPTRPRPTVVPPSVAAAPPAAGHASSRQYWLDRAAHDARRLSSDKKTRYAVQLELACEVGSLVDAFQHDRPAGTMWVLETSYQGRTCFRVLWGRYATPEAARRAVSSVPRFFVSSKNHPAATGVR